MKREQWLQERRKGIGSSDIGAIIGVNKYTEPYDIYMQKVEGVTVEDNDAMKRGRFLEDAIPLFFEDKTGYICTKPEKPIYKHPEFDKKPFFATPDFYYKDETNTDCIFEAKTYRGFLTGDFEADLDESYYAQIQWQMHCTGIKRATIGVLAAGFDFYFWTFDYDAKYCQVLEEKALDFWNNYVVKQVKPQPMSKRTNELKYPSEEEGKVITASEEFREKHNKLLKAQHHIKQWTTVADHYKEQLCVIMADAEEVIYGESRLATYKLNKAKKRVFRVYDN